MNRLVIFSCVVLALVAVTSARSGEPRESRRQCGEWTYEECVPKKGTCGAGRKHGTRTGENCRVTERHFRCLVPCEEGGEVEGPSDLAGLTHGSDGRRQNSPVRCRYSRSVWGECDATTSEKTRTLTLKKGDETCEQTKIETKKCRAAGECKYGRATWGECDPITNEKTRIVTLKRGDASTCEATKTETKACKGAKSNVCKYKRGKWGDCDTTTNERTRTLTLKRGDANTCEATKTETKPCRASNGCKFGRGENSTWTPCTEGEMHMNLVLKQGDPATCGPTQIRTKRCVTKRSVRTKREVDGAGNNCRYRRGRWGTCDSRTNEKTRTNSLKKGDSASCPASQTESRPCKRPCRYNKGDWSECTSAKRTRQDAIKDGSDPECDATRTIERKCKAQGEGRSGGGKGGRRAGGRNRNRRRRCQFGEWTEYGACNQGVRTRTREVLSGGPKCQMPKKTVETDMCQ